MRKWTVILMTLALAFASAPFAHAQLLIPGATSALVIILTPNNPRPGEQVLLRVTSPLYDLRESDITWRANGTVIAEGSGVTETSIIVGAAGSATDVSVASSGSDGAAVAQVRIIPASVDLLWESDSYTPPFYRGRALAGAGSSVRIVAIPHLIRPGGAEIPSSQITYTWRKNGTVLGNLSGRGKSSITTPAAVLFDSNVISVEAVAADRSISASNSVRIDTAETPLRLYQNHPLFGRLFHQALGVSTFISESEMVFEAIPYFANVRTARDRSLIYEWKVNQNAITADASAPNAITINAEGSTGIASVNLDVFNSNNVFFETDGRWEITFRSTGGSQGIGNDPFRPTE